MSFVCKSHLYYSASIIKQILLCTVSHDEIKAMQVCSPLHQLLLTKFSNKEHFLSSSLNEEITKPVISDS